VDRQLETKTEMPKALATPEVKALLARLRANDRSLTNAEACAVLDFRPKIVDLDGDPAKYLLGSLLKRYSGGDALVRESLARRVAQVKAELSGVDPTAMESLLAERAALCWLTVYLHEMADEMRTGITVQEATYQQRKVDSAHRRFLSAVKMLAIVRKLALPDVRINIDGRSVHFGGKPDTGQSQEMPPTRGGG